MTQSEFDQLKTTFPWTEQTMVTGVGGLVRVVDRHGAEVPIFTMTKFLMMITRHLTVAEKKEAKT